MRVRYSAAAIALLKLAPRAIVTLAIVATGSLAIHTAIKSGIHSRQTALIGAYVAAATLGIWSLLRRKRALNLFAQSLGWAVIAIGERIADAKEPFWIAWACLSLWCAWDAYTLRRDNAASSATSTTE